MPKLLDRLMRRGSDVAAAIHDRKLTHLERWRAIAASHAAGQPVNIEELEKVAFHLRFSPELLESDAAALRDHADASRRLADAQADMTRCVEAYEAAAAEIWSVRQRLAQLEFALTGPETASYACGAARRELNQIEEANPRLFAAANAIATKSAEPSTADEQSLEAFFEEEPS